MLSEGTLLSGGEKDRRIIAWDSLQNYKKITETKVSWSGHSEEAPVNQWVGTPALRASGAGRAGPAYLPRRLGPGQQTDGLGMVCFR
jgi:hypothetical protein